MSRIAELFYQRIEDPLLERARTDPHKPAVVDGDHVWSYDELVARAQRLAAQLLQRGLEPGDRVAIYLDKTTSSVVALYGAWLAGGVAVPINEGLRSRQVEHIVRDSGIRLFISESRKVTRLEPGAVGDADVLEVDAGVTREWTPLGLRGGQEAATILYTSGSTGRPKGILISHENLLAGARIVARYLEIQHDERLLSILPFSFDYGLNQLLTSVSTGATLVLQRSHFPADIHKSLARHAITAMAGVPPLWIQLLGDSSPLTQAAFPHLRYITNSGGVFPTELVARCRRVLPTTRLYLMYGLSEAFRSTYLPPEEVDRRPGSMGRAIPETEIYVLDEDGCECGPGKVGELVHSGPTVALGYWRDPEATAARFREHPFAPPGSAERVVYSGDLVRRDEEGFLYFVGRRDQLLKCQGFRVSPDEVEETIFASGLVAEVIVHGIPDPVSGQAIVAHVVPREVSAFSEQELLTYCRRQMPHYMVPRAVRTHTALPRTASGKIDRKGIAS
ncbi:MAG: acyl-CoA ligase (AMP-forming), exosortase system type 1 associated [Myxococcales bacterium]|nr:acyl-CoA ligase (AMP-forming), exosortase system type 1 associated [Myxococcales bacterium]